MVGPGRPGAAQWGSRLVPRGRPRAVPRRPHGRRRGARDHRRRAGGGRRRGGRLAAARGGRGPRGRPDRRAPPHPPGHPRPRPGGPRALGRHPGARAPRARRRGGVRPGRDGVGQAGPRDGRPAGRGGRRRDAAVGRQRRDRGRPRRPRGPHRGRGPGASPGRLGRRRPAGGSRGARLGRAGVRHRDRRRTAGPSRARVVGPRRRRRRPPAGGPARPRARGPVDPADERRLRAGRHVPRRRRAVVLHAVRPRLAVGRPDAAAAGHRPGRRDAARARAPGRARSPTRRAPSSRARSCTRSAPSRSRSARATGCSRRSTTGPSTPPRCGCCLLHDAWRWGMPADEVEALLPRDGARPRLDDRPRRRRRRRLPGVRRRGRPRPGQPGLEGLRRLGAVARRLARHRPDRAVRGAGVRARGRARRRRPARGVRPSGRGPLAAVGGGPRRPLPGGVLGRGRRPAATRPSRSTRTSAPSTR